MSNSSSQWTLFDFSQESILTGWIFWAVGLGLFSTRDSHSGVGKADRLCKFDRFRRWTDSSAVITPQPKAETKFY